MSASTGRVLRVPSRSHEERRTLLESIAEIGGYRLGVALPDGRRPDVLRLHLHRRAVFFGEAKHTEGPADTRSVDRLRHYVGWLAPFSQWDVGSVLAVAHGRGVGDLWSERLDWLCGEERIEGRIGSKDVTRVTTVTFVVVGSGDSPRAR